MYVNTPDMYRNPYREYFILERGKRNEQNQEKK